MKIATILTQTARDAKSAPRTVNLPVQRASTVVFDSLAHLDSTQQRFNADEVVPTYGIVNMPLRAAFEELAVAIEGGHRAVTVPSGLAAVTAALLAALKPGDHLLMTDGCYGPTRRFCDSTLKRLGVETTFYDPLIGGHIATLMRPNTCAVYLENPSSHTFEVQDVPAMVRAAHAGGAVAIMDNAWATGLYFNAFAHGVDMVVQPVTKYYAGHSDVLMGTVVTNERCWPALRDTTRELGLTTSPDDIALALRGMRTMEVRLARHYASTLTITQWLSTRPEAKRVLYPALPGNPGHALWKRDFTGASGLFAVELEPASSTQVAAMLDHYRYFAIGYSWGGFESLVVPASLRHGRSIPWTGGPLIRYHVGLEDPQDLIDDLERGFERLRTAR